MSSEADGTPPPGTIRLRGVSKAYDRSVRKRWSTALPWGEPSRRNEIYALDGIDLDVAPGEALGLIGRNGAGKSTILKLLAGVAAPTSGTVECVGRIGSMIELGLGFNPELTGRENARGTAAIMGLTAEETDASMDDIIAFSGIARAMDTPLKHYSTGMRARLGFAVAVHVPTDILLIDEVLAVGDEEFQLRCIDRIAQMQAAGTTLLFVSHATWLVADVCERSIHVRRGRIVDDGPSAEVVERYLTPAPADLASAERPTMRFHSFDLRTPAIKPWGTLELEADVEVSEPTSEPAIALDLSWVHHSPDKSIARVMSPLPSTMREPGRYRLVGRSNELPADSGVAGVRVALVDEATQRLHDLQRGEFVVDGTVTRRGPQLAADIEFSLVRLEGLPVAGDGDEPDDDTSTPTPDAALPDAGPDPLAVEAVGLVKRFHSGVRRGGLRSALPGYLARREANGDIVALDGVDIALPPGHCLGIIGPNGSGKSTFLKIVAGVAAPTEGVLTSRGRLVSMLELGIGFHPDLSGEENIRQTVGLLGLDPASVPDLLPGIVEFADIGDALQAPLKQYSSGMRTRLGLALAVNAQPELLLIDEALAVGDRPFQKKAVSTVRELGAQGCTTIFVSHDLGLVEEMCDWVVRLEQGRIVDQGPAALVIDRSGGAGWDQGVTQFTSAVRLNPLELSTRMVQPGGPLTCEGMIEVFEPSPTIRIEFAYLSKTGNPNELSHEHLKATTIFSRVVIPAGGDLVEPGRYRFSATMASNPVLGEMYVMVTAIEEIEGVVTAQSWQDVKVGNRVRGEVVMIPLEVDWELEPVADDRRDEDVPA